MKLRKHQSDFDAAIAGIINGLGVRDIVVHATPGAGKSTLPVQAGKLITAGIADKICWIAPRMSLQDQAERNFIDPFFRKMFGHNLVIRSSTNEINPSRGTNGFVTTYQAAGADVKKTILTDFNRHRYILVLDEFHHLEAEDGEWTRAIAPLYEQAVVRVLMTGTLSRGDAKKIAFTPYDQIGDRFTPCFHDSPKTVAIRYNRKDALADQAIIPLAFHFADGTAKWQKESGKIVEAKISTGRYDANQALYTALKTEYAQELLGVGVDHWQNHRKTINPSGTLLVVAASIESAKEYTAILKQQGLHAEIATSDDTLEAVKQIKSLKAGKLRILVTVAMAYEGLDVPSISHIICLTNIRSAPWIEQMVARAVRIDPQAGPYETQKGYIFAQADKLFMKLAADIEADQTEALAIATKKKTPLAPGEQESLFGDPRPGITPLSSKLIGAKQNVFSFAGYQQEAQQTQRELENELREEINNNIKRFCRTYNVRHQYLNGELKRMFGRAREEMTVRELESLRAYVAAQYPVPQGICKSERAPLNWRSAPGV